MDLCLGSARALADALARKELSSRDLLEVYLQRVDKLNPELNAVVTLDVEGATARATELDDIVARSGPVGRLHGLPITVKDALETAGMRTTSGAKEFADHVPERDADAVARLKAAGAVIFGKTNMPAYADDHQTDNELFGRTNNPWDLSLTSGGSSGGSAVAVAAGLTSFEVGSDIGNSIRSPASHCGIYGHKPTYGLVPYRGHIPPRPGALAPPDLSVVGPMARSAEDLSFVMSVLGGTDYDPEPRVGPLDNLRVAAWLDDPDNPTAPEVLDVLEGSLDRLEAAGLHVDRGARPKFSMRDARRIYRALLVAAQVQGLPDAPDLVQEHLQDDGPAGIWARNASMSHREWLELDEERRRLQARWAEFFSDFDALITPCNPLPPFAHDSVGGFDPERLVTIGERQYRYYSQSLWAGLSGVAYLPGTSAPAGRTHQGAPVGLQIIGPLGGDATCISAAASFASLLGGYEPPPMALL